METVNLTTQNYEILNSGVVIIPTNEYLEFDIRNLKFRICFKEDEGEKQGSNFGHYSIDIKNDGTGEYMEISIINQKNSFLSSSRNYIDVATLSKRKLLLRFSISSINKREEDKEEDKLFYYTWYLEKEVKEIK